MLRRTKLLLAVLPCALVAGCAGENTVEVQIEDGRITTFVQVESGCTVGDALEAAELELADDDKVSPNLTEVVTDAPIVISREYDVSVSENGENIRDVRVSGDTVADALAVTDVTVGEFDVINHSVDAYLTDGMSIEITYRVQVLLTVDGETKKVVTAAETVEELLAEQNISVNEKDRVSMGMSDEVSTGDKLVIERVNVKNVTETEEVAYETQTEYSDSMYAGETKVKQAGAYGEKELTYEVTFVDGEETDRRLVSEKITKAPVNQIIVQGTKQKETVPSGNGKTVVSRVQNYDCDNSGHGWWTITYSDGTVEYIDF